MFDQQSAQDLLCVCNLTADASAGGESQGGVMEASGCPGRHLEAEEGLYLPEPDRASLHDSEGLLNVHTTWSGQNLQRVLTFVMSKAESGDLFVCLAVNEPDAF